MWHSQCHWHIKDPVKILPLTFGDIRTRPLKHRVTKANQTTYKPCISLKNFLSFFFYPAGSIFITIGLNWTQKVNIEETCFSPQIWTSSTQTVCAFIYRHANMWSSSPTPNPTIISLCLPGHFSYILDTLVEVPAATIHRMGLFKEHSEALPRRTAVSGTLLSGDPCVCIDISVGVVCSFAHGARIQESQPEETQGANKNSSVVFVKDQYVSLTTVIPYYLKFGPWVLQGWSRRDCHCSVG